MNNIAIVDYGFHSNDVVVHAFFQHVQQEGETHEGELSSRNLGGRESQGYVEHICG